MGPKAVKQLPNAIHYTNVPSNVAMYRKIGPQLFYT